MYHIHVSQVTIINKVSSSLMYSDSVACMQIGYCSEYIIALIETTLKQIILLIYVLKGVIYN